MQETKLHNAKPSSTSSNLFLKMLAERPWLLADGATGSNLFDMGLVSGDAPELWNFQHPDRITKLHQSFADAGADIILTNSFGGSRYRLQLHQAQDRVRELNIQAAQLVKGVVDKAQRPIVVAGSMGPTGEILQPLGSLSLEDATAAFAEQAQALAEGGADVLWIETMSSREEIEAAIAGASVTGLPIVTTVSFDTNGRSMMGLSAQDLNTIIAQSPHPVAACGTNCGVGASEVVATIHNLVQSADPNAVFVAKGNCGIPQYVDGKICYNGSPELMAVYACMAYDAGARIIGGCCGTSPKHLAAMHQALLKHTKQPAPSLEAVIENLGEVSSGARAQWSGDSSRAAGAAPGANTNRGNNRRRAPTASR